MNNDRSHGISLARLVLVVVSAIALPEPAAACIQCQGNFQITKYGPIATPYCEEEQIAFVARSYGSKVTAAQVHNDPLTKVYELSGSTRAGSRVASTDSCTRLARASLAFPRLPRGPCPAAAAPPSSSARLYA